jgi:hypothetical protein
MQRNLVEELHWFSEQEFFDGSGAGPAFARTAGRPTRHVPGIGAWRICECPVGGWDFHPPLICNGPDTLRCVCSLWRFALDAISFLRDRSGRYRHHCALRHQAGEERGKQGSIVVGQFFSRSWFQPR